MLLCTLFNLFDADLVPSNGTVFDPVPFGVGNVVDEHASSDDAASLGPIVDSVLLEGFFLGNLVVGEPVVV